jgi:hypothetical protein
MSNDVESSLSMLSFSSVSVAEKQAAVDKVPPALWAVSDFRADH